MWVNEYTLRGSECLVNTREIAIINRIRELYLISGVKLILSEFGDII